MAVEAVVARRSRGTDRPVPEAPSLKATGQQGRVVGPAQQGQGQGQDEANHEVRVRCLLKLVLHILALL